MDTNKLSWQTVPAKIVKFLMQPGRIFFPKGPSFVDKTYDSFSVEYLLIAQEQSRLALFLVPSIFTKNALLSLILLPILILRFILLFIRFCIVTQIIKSYLNSNELKKILLKKYETSRT